MNYNNPTITTTQYEYSGGNPMEQQDMGAQQQQQQQHQQQQYQTPSYQASNDQSWVQYGPRKSKIPAWELRDYQAPPPNPKWRPAASEPQLHPPQQMGGTSYLPKDIHARRAKEEYQQQMAQQGRKRWTLEQLRATDAILPAQLGSNQFASQRGMTSFGMGRDVVKGTNVHRLDEDLYGMPQWTRAYSQPSQAHAQAQAQQMAGYHDTFGQL